jgi:hypothetical protein
LLSNCYYERSYLAVSTGCLSFRVDEAGAVRGISEADWVIVLLARASSNRGQVMQDLLWVTIMVGLLAATLACARLCDNA